MSGGRKPVARKPVAKKPRNKKPRSKASIWAARALVLAVLLFFVVGVIFGVKAIIAAIGGAFESNAKASAEMAQENKEAEEKAASAATHAPPQPCTAQELGFQASSPSGEFGVGAGAIFGVEVTNKGTLPCLMDSGPGTLGVQLRSGNQIIWTSATCGAGSEPVQLLLSPGDTWSAQIPWHARVQGPECGVAGGIAKAGTYRVIAMKDGNALGEERVFVLH